MSKPHHHHKCMNEQELKNAIKAGLVSAGTTTLLFNAPAMLGFGAAGIAKGSIAAWMMSLSGGATQAGSVVAILQSVGAVGFGLMGGAAILGIGALVGGASYAAMKHKQKKQRELSHCTCCECCKYCTKRDGDCCDNCTCPCHYN